ncbi:Lipid A biosynthesis lauroyltransferase [Alishewanella longhuensis]
MIGKRDVKGLIQALNEQEVCFYLPDQDYGRNRAEFVPFFAVSETATTVPVPCYLQKQQTVLLSLYIHRDYRIIRGIRLKFYRPLPSFQVAMIKPM